MFIFFTLQTVLSTAAISSFIFLALQVHVFDAKKTHLLQPSRSFQSQNLTSLLLQEILIAASNCDARENIEFSSFRTFDKVDK